MLSGVDRQSRAAEVSHIDPTWMYGTKNSTVKRKGNFSAASPQEIMYILVATIDYSES